MKTLVETVLEGMNAAEAILMSIKTDGLKADQMINILCQNDMKTLQAISGILKAKYKDEYFPYEPTKDDFLKDTNKEKVAGQIVDAVINLDKK